MAAPVFAAVSYKLDGLLNYRSGIQTALQEGLGQSLGQSVTNDGVKLTINTAVVDDNRMVLIYNISSQNAPADYLNFSKMELKDSHGRIVEGRQSQIWDKASQTWNGYFEADWTPDSLVADVQFTAKSLHSFSSVERDLVFNPFNDKNKSFTIKQDGIGQLKVQPFVQGDEMMLTTEVNYDQPKAKEWVAPFIGVYKDNVLVKGVGTSVFGTPGEQGEFISKQFFKLSDLKLGI